jgi:hypothetical protein
MSQFGAVIVRERHAASIAGQPAFAAGATATCG